MRNRDLRTRRKAAIEAKHGDWPATGWEPELLQDANRDLSYWLSERIDSRMHAREAGAEKEKR